MARNRSGPDRGVSPHTSSGAAFLTFVIGRRNFLPRTASKQRASNAVNPINVEGRVQSAGRGTRRSQRGRTRSIRTVRQSLKRLLLTGSAQVRSLGAIRTRGHCHSNDACSTVGDTLVEHPLVRAALREPRKPCGGVERPLRIALPGLSFP
jgi:hypothetical protein